MSLSFHADDSPKPDHKDWAQVLIHIANKRTHTDEFNRLVGKIRTNRNHAYLGELKKLESLYDFTPIQEAGEGEELL